MCKLGLAAVSASFQQEDVSIIHFYLYMYSKISFWLLSRVIYLYIIVDIGIVFGYDPFFYIFHTVKQR